MCKITFLYYKLSITISFRMVMKNIRTQSTHKKTSISELRSPNSLRQNFPQLKDPQFHKLSFLKSKNHTYAHGQLGHLLVSAGRLAFHGDVHTGTTLSPVGTVRKFTFLNTWISYQWIILCQPFTKTSSSRLWFVQNEQESGQEWRVSPPGCPNPGKGFSVQTCTHFASFCLLLCWEDNVWVWEQLGLWRDGAQGLGLPCYSPRLPAPVANPPLFNYSTYKSFCSRLLPLVKPVVRCTV